VRPERLGKFKKFVHFFRSRTRDLPACSIVPSEIKNRKKKEVLGELADFASLIEREIIRKER
jgi:hypothetical protein